MAEEVRLNITATDSASPAIDSVEGSLRDLTKAEQRQITTSKKWSDNLESNAAKVSSSMNAVGIAAVASGTAVVGAYAGVISIASSFEDSFAGVRKTVEASPAEFEALSDSIRQLSTEIPISVHTLNSLGEAAGQLGIKKENLVDFIETMAQVGVTTNLSAEEAATAFARFGNIMDTNQGQFSNLASSLVDLGNNFATTEAEIMTMGLRLAGAGRQLDLTEPQVLGLATAMSSLGLRAEAGGTAMSKMMIQMAAAVETGNEDLAKFSAVTAQVGVDFRQVFEEDAGAAIQAFLEGLGKIDEGGGSVLGVLSDLGIEEVRMRDAMLRLAGASDLVGEAMERGTRAFEENAALAKEAEQRFETLSSQMTILWNSISDVAIAIGTALLPTVKEMVSILKDMVPFLAEAAELFASLPVGVHLAIAAMGALTIAVGGFLLVGAQVLTMVAGIVAAMGTLGISATAVSAAVVGLGGAFATAAGVLSTAALKFAAVGGAAFLLTGFLVDLTGGAEIFHNTLGSLINRMRGFNKVVAEASSLIDRQTGLVEGAAESEARMAVRRAEAAAATQEAAGATSEYGEALGDLAGGLDDIGGAASGAADGVGEVAAEVEALAANVEQISLLAAEFQALQGMSQGGFLLPTGTADPGGATPGLVVGQDRMNAAIALGRREIEGAASATRDWAATMDDVADAAGHLSGLLSTLGAGTLSNLAGIVSDTASEFARATTNAERFSAVASGIAAIGAEIGGAWGGAFSGAAEGAQLGAQIAGPWGAVAGAVAGGIAGFVTGAQAEEMAVNDLRDAFLEAQGGWEAFQVELAAASDEDLLAAIFNAETVQEYDAAVLAATTALNEHAAAQALLGEAQNALNEAVNRYGFTIDQLGPTLQRQMLNEQAQQLLQDFSLLTASGMDLDVVLGGMSDSVNEYVQASLAAGQAIPESMRPMIEQMIEAGLLLDENGNAFESVEDAGLSFTQSLEEGLGDAVDAINALVAALTGIGPVTIPVNVQYNDPGFTPGGPNRNRNNNNRGPDAHAASGFFSPELSRDTLIQAHQGERVEITPRNETRAGGGGGGTTVNYNPSIVINGVSDAQLTETFGQILHDDKEGLMSLIQTKMEDTR